MGTFSLTHWPLVRDGTGDRVPSPVASDLLSRAHLVKPWCVLLNDRNRRISGLVKSIHVPGEHWMEDSARMAVKVPIPASFNPPSGGRG